MDKKFVIESLKSFKLSDEQKQRIQHGVDSEADKKPPVVRARFLVGAVAAIVIAIICLPMIANGAFNANVRWVKSGNAMMDVFGVDGYNQINESYIGKIDGKTAVKGSGEVYGGVLVAYAGYEDDDIMTLIAGEMYEDSTYEETVTVNGIEIRWGKSEVDATNYRFVYYYNYITDGIEHFDVVSSQYDGMGEYYISRLLNMF